MGPQILLYAPLQPISICLWEAVLHFSQIGIPLPRLALELREWPQLLSGTGCCFPYFPSSPHMHCRPWLLLHQPPHQNLELWCWRGPCEPPGQSGAEERGWALELDRAGVL